MFKRIIDFFMYAGISPSEYGSIRDKITRSNFESLRAYSIMATFFFTVTLITAIVSNMTAMSAKTVGYGSSAAASLTILILTLLTGVKHPKVTKYLVYAMSIVLLLFGLFVSLVAAPKQLTVSLLAMYMVAPLLFTDKPYRIQTIIIITDIWFIACALQVKPAEIIHLEIVDCIVFSSIGMFIGMFTSKVKLQRLVFEKQIAELNDKETLSNYLKSIAHIYVSMHYINLANGTFLSIKSNEFIDSSLKNKYKGYKKQVKLAVAATTCPEYLEKMQAFANPDTLPERIRGKRTITHEFLGKNFGWCRARYIAVGDVTEDSIPEYVIYAVENINEQRNREKTLITMAETDAMTSLLNRQAGIDQIKDRLSKNQKGMLCLLDVDKFKHINDTFGHQVGDEVIIKVAETMRRAFRDNDILMRLGGDEYVVYVNGIVSEERGRMVLTRFFDMLGELKFESMPDYSLSVSLGATIYKGDSNPNFDELYHQADTCTYQSKKTEGCTFSFWHD